MKERMQRLNIEKRTIRAANYAANTVGITMLFSLLLNIVLIPYLWMKKPWAAGSSVQILEECILYLLIFFLPFYLLSRLRGWRIGELFGSGRPKLIVYVMVICLAVGWNLTATVLAAGLETFLNQFGIAEAGSDYITPLTGTAAALQIVQIAILPPLVEELCYRGFLMQAAARSVGLWYGILLSSAAFWMSHHSLTILPLAFGFGILGGVLREKYDTLLPSVLAHCVINGSYLIVNRVQDTMTYSGQMKFTVGQVVIEAICMAVGIALAVQMGLFRTLREIIDRSEHISKKAVLRGCMTSIPFLLMILTTIYFTGRSWKPL